MTRSDLDSVVNADIAATDILPVYSPADVDRAARMGVLPQPHNAAPMPRRTPPVFGRKALPVDYDFGTDLLGGADIMGMMCHGPTAMFTYDTDVRPCYMLAYSGQPITGVWGFDWVPCWKMYVTYRHYWGEPTHIRVLYLRTTPKTIGRSNERTSGAAAPLHVADIRLHTHKELFGH